MTRQTWNDDAEVPELLVDLADALHATGVPTDLVEREVGAVARTEGVPARTLLLQSAVVVDTGEEGHEKVVLRRIDFENHWNLRRLGSFMDVSNDLAAGRMGPSERRSALARIRAEGTRWGRWPVLVGYAIYGAAVAARVGGAWLEMAVAALVGLVAGAVHFGAGMSRKIDLQKTLLAGFGGGLCVLVLGQLLPPFDAARAVFGGVTLLVPAMVITIGTHELANDAIESGLFRLAHGMLRFVMLGFGVLGAFKLWSLALPLPASAPAHRLPELAVLAILAVGGVGLSMCVQARKRDIPWVVGGVLFAYGVQELTKAVFGGDGSPALAAAAVGVAGALVGRSGRHIPAVVVVPGFLQLAPGFIGTQAVFHSIEPGRVDFSKTFFDVFLVALQLVSGLILAGLLVPMEPRRARRAASAPAE